jgi:RNA ligase (TIGR02306 family)
MRQLVTIRTVSELIPIEGADVIELAKVDGWQCVVKKGDFSVGDPGIFFEIDSMIPSSDERFAFLSKGKIQAHYRIKSMKLRGALSQGLLMPMFTLTMDEIDRWNKSEESGETLTEILGVQKYEPPVPIQGVQKGNFPTHLVPKTDQERIQNIPKVLEGRTGIEFEITEKLDGTSCTFYFKHMADAAIAEVGEEFPENKPVYAMGACSRNWEMKLDDDNIYAKLWHGLGLHSKLAALGRSLAIQGEIIGPRIQGNKYKRGAQEFYVFDIYDIDEQRYLWPVERIKLVNQLELLHVPQVQVLQGTKLDMQDPPFTLETILDAADGKSQLCDTKREGLVFKHHGRYDGTQSPLRFKAISNKFLLKHE